MYFWAYLFKIFIFIDILSKKKNISQLVRIFEVYLKFFKRMNI